jgi:hypothetical protein
MRRHECLPRVPRSLPRTAVREASESADDTWPIRMTRSSQEIASEKPGVIHELISRFTHWYCLLILPQVALSTDTTRGSHALYPPAPTQIRPLF